MKRDREMKQRQKALDKAARRVARKGEVRTTKGPPIGELPVDVPEVSDDVPPVVADPSIPVTK